MPYEAPEWSQAPDEPYFLQTLKNGQIIDETDMFKKAVVTIGRLPVCDLSLEHASVSRYHAVLQFAPRGDVFVYDLGSAHGTFVNKKRVEKRKWIKLKVGDFMRFGESSRMHVLMGPAVEEEEDVQVVERKAKREDVQVSWGFKEDAEADEIVVASSEPYMKDPKKFLRNWGEENELKVQYIHETISEKNVFQCKAITDFILDSGHELVGRGEAKNKKDAERQAALDVCRQLDRLGIFVDHDAIRKAELRRMKELLGDEDNQGDDEFYDRTLSKSAKAHSHKEETKEPQTVEALTLRQYVLESQIEELEQQIKDKQSGKQKMTTEEPEEEDALDAFMNQVHSKVKEQDLGMMQKQLDDLRHEFNENQKMLEKMAPPKTIPHIVSLSETGAMKNAPSKRPPLDELEASAKSPPKKRVMTAPSRPDNYPQYQEEEDAVDCTRFMSKKS